MKVGGSGTRGSYSSHVKFRTFLILSNMNSQTHGMNEGHKHNQAKVEETVLEMAVNPVATAVNGRCLMIIPNTQNHMASDSVHSSATSVEKQGTKTIPSRSGLVCMFHYSFSLAVLYDNVPQEALASRIYKHFLSRYIKKKKKAMKHRHENLMFFIFVVLIHTAQSLNALG
jgi:hypothetical protein